MCICKYIYHTYIMHTAAIATTRRKDLSLWQHVKLQRRRAFCCLPQHCWQCNRPRTTPSFGFPVVFFVWWKCFCNVFGWLVFFWIVCYWWTCVIWTEKLERKRKRVTYTHSLSGSHIRTRALFLFFLQSVVWKHREQVRPVCATIDGSSRLGHQGTLRWSTSGHRRG